MSRLIKWIFIGSIGVVCVATAWFHFRPSGTFVAHGPHLAVLLNLTERYDGKLSGQYQETSLDNDGRVVNRSYSVDGFADRGSLSLSFKEMDFIPASETVSGRFNGTELVLTFVGKGDPITQTFQRADLGQFQNLANIVRLEATQVEAQRESLEAARKLEKRRTDISNEVQITLSKIEKLNSGLEQFVNATSNIEEQYKIISAKMQSALNQDRGLAGYSDASYKRDQLLYAIGQDAFQTEQIKNQVQTTHSNFDNNVLAVAKRAFELKDECRSFMDGNLVNFCAGLIAALPNFEAKVGAAGNALSRLDKVYMEEKTKQNQIEAEAGQIQ